ncbi:MAG: hypothetical protein N2Z72_06625 [Bacteroidales bacterium]|nr:hypothetical protein [Bacteroidales bacterium]
MLWILLLFFITFYPTVRVLVIGHRSYLTTYELFFSLLPDIFILLFGIAAVFLSETNPLKLIKQKKIKLEIADIILIFYILIYIALGLIHLAYPIAFFHAIRITFLPLVFYVIFRFLSEKETKFLLMILMWWLFGLSFLASGLYLFSHEIFLKIYELLDIPTWEYIIPRLSFLIWSPVVFGSCMALGLFLSQLFIKKTLLRFLIAVVFSISLVLTMSRGAILSTLLTLIFVFIVSKDFRFSSLAYLATFLFIFFSLSFILTKSTDLAFWTFQSTEKVIQGTSEESRDISYSQIIHDVHHAICKQKDTTFFPPEKLVLGSGLGTAGHVGMKYSQKFDFPFYPATLDGYYLKIFIETGLIGLFIFLLIMGSLFMWYLIQFIKRKQPMLLLPTLLLFYTLIQNAVSNAMDFYFYSYVFWAILASFKIQSYE